MKNSKLKFKIQNLKQDVSLAPFSTFAIGGKADYFVSVNSSERLAEILSQVEKSRLKYKLFAGGSNVVFPDEGIDRLVIQVLGGKTVVDGLNVTVDTGVLLSDLIDKAVSSGLSGPESLSGIPGTVGGAVVGNAGAYGREISDVVEKVEVWDGRKRFFLDNRGCRFSYRESIFKRKQKLIVLRIYLKLKKGKAGKLKQISKKIIKVREAKYKPGLKCPGSFFKNILVSNLNKSILKSISQDKIIYGKIPAGFLLEDVGAKEMRVGDVEVAPFHGNLFINRGKGKAEDVKKLAKILKARVKKKFGIELEEEIRYF